MTTYIILHRYNESLNRTFLYEIVNLDSVTESRLIFCKVSEACSSAKILLDFCGLKIIFLVALKVELPFSYKQKFRL